MKYFYVVFTTPFGIVPVLHRSNLHPLHKEAIKERIAAIKSQAIQQTGQISLTNYPEEMFTVTFCQEMPTEVAESYWPDDFKHIFQYSTQANL